jgi:hypothetical protein
VEHKVIQNEREVSTQKINIKNSNISLSAIEMRIAGLEGHNLSLNKTNISDAETIM